MAKEVYIPKQGQTVEEVTLVRWLAADGAKVEQGQEILEIETDKAVFSVEASATGYLHLGPYKEGDVVPVLTIVAVIGKPEDKFTPATRPGEPADAASVKSAPSAPAVVAGGDGQETEKAKAFASPRARKLAEAKGVDLAQVTPTGGGGQRVAERDVLAYLANLPQAPSLRGVCL